MSVGLKNSNSKGSENSVTSEDQQEKINEVRKLIGEFPEKLSLYSSDASVSRYLRARNWNVKKATKMLKETLKWRVAYKPEDIQWDDIAREAETGKVYKSNYVDKLGRTVLVMRPSYENSKSTKAQIKYLVYCMEKAIQSLPEDQEQMVWLIDFHGFSLSNISVKVTRETAHVLQDHYPERLGLAIMYNPPKFFEPFYKVVKPFLEPKTANKVKFVYSDDPSTMKIMEDHFDVDQLESAFGGKDDTGFDINKYAERMREDDKRTLSSGEKGSALEGVPQPDPTNSESDLEASDEKAEKALSHGVDSEEVSSHDALQVTKY